MTETLRFIARRISETPDEVLMFSFSLLSLVGIILVAYWFYNRRKIHQLSHQIPASVVKNYLDSIIQNSSALKSSLFRGGGLEVGEGVPSVMPVGDLPRGNVTESSGASSEELNQKIAEIASLTKRLSDKDRMIRDLESKLEGTQATDSEGSDSAEEIAMLKDEIKRLKKELSEALENAQAPAASADNSKLKGELEEVTKERDELKERLMEYEIIEEDLANLKRLQQENEQLKNQLVGLGKEPDTVTPAKKEEVKEESQEKPQEAPQEEPKEEPQAETQEGEQQEEQAQEALKEEHDAKVETDTESGGEGEEESVSAKESKPQEEQKGEEDEEKKKDSSNDSDQKSAEELLSEFERMLG